MDSDDEVGDDDFQAHIFRTNFRDDLDDVVRKYPSISNYVGITISYKCSLFLSQNIVTSVLTKYWHFCHFSNYSVKPFIFYSEPKPSLGLRYAYFDVISSPPTTAEQRRHYRNWSNNWRLFWRFVLRRGRHYQEHNHSAPDEKFPTPLSVQFYLGVPGVWATLPTG